LRGCFRPVGPWLITATGAAADPPLAASPLWSCKENSVINAEEKGSLPGPPFVVSLYSHIRIADVLALVHAGDREGSAQGGRFHGKWQRAQSRSC
jgi:hypothetical protein